MCIYIYIYIYIGEPGEQRPDGVDYPTKCPNP